jgi:hypothetical protein
MGNRLDDDLYVDGNLSAKTVTLPASSVTDAMIAGSAGIKSTKVQQVRNLHWAFQDSTVTAAVCRQIVHALYGATGTILDFSVGAVTANVGGATVTIDLKKNGSSILTGTFTLDNTTPAFTLKANPGLTSSSLVAGDILEAAITSATAGGGTIAKGVFCRLVLNEDPQ